MKAIFTALSAILTISHTLALPTFSRPHTLSIKTRASDTCGNPQTSTTYHQGYSPSATAHMVVPITYFVSAATVKLDWVIQNSVFRAWDSQQPGTVPLYTLVNPLNPAADDMLVLGNPDGSLPSAPGYFIENQPIWVYPTQVCGSVPLYSMFSTSITDHYYTIDPTDIARMESSGYVSQGIVAYVLPVDCGCSS